MAQSLTDSHCTSVTVTPCCNWLPHDATQSAVLPWHVVRPSACLSVCLSILTAAELIENLDDDLFQQIPRDKNHLLPDRRRCLDYGLRPRSLENWFPFPKLVP